MKDYAEQFSYLSNDNTEYEIFASLDTREYWDLVVYDNIPVIPFTYDIDNFDSDGTKELLIANIVLDERDYGYTKVSIMARH